MRPFSSRKKKSLRREQRIAQRGDRAARADQQYAQQSYGEDEAKQTLAA